MTLLQIYACRREGARQVVRLSSQIEAVSELRISWKLIKPHVMSLHMPGCDSWTLSHIMWCIVWHENPTEEDGEDPT